MKKTNLQEIKTRPGDVIELWKWVDGVLKFVDYIPHERNLGPYSLTPGLYAYYIVSEVNSLWVQ